MAFNYYSTDPEPSGPAYEMLLRAELAKAEALGNFWDPIQRSLKNNAQLQRVDRELAGRERAQRADEDYRKGHLALQSRELDIRERRDEREAGSAATLNRGVQSMLSGRGQRSEPAPSEPVSRATPFERSGPATEMQRQPYDAQAILRQGMAQNDDPMSTPDPEMLQGMTPEDQSRFIGMWNTIHDNVKQRRAEAAKEQQTAQTKQGVQRMLSIDTANPKSEPYFDAAERMQINALPPEEGAKMAGTIYAKKRDYKVAAEDIGLTVKELRKAIQPEDPNRQAKLAAIADLEVLPRGEKDAQKLNDAAQQTRAFVHGTDSQSRTESAKADKHEFDFGDGQKRAVPPAVMQGGPMPGGRFPDAVDAWVRSVALDQMARDPKLLGVAGGMLKDEERKPIEDAYYQRVKQQVASNFGWKETTGPAISPEHTQSLPYGSGAPSGQEPLEYPTQSAPVEEGQAPKQAQAPAAQPKPPALGELEPGQRAEAAKIMAAKGEQAALEYLLKVRSENAEKAAGPGTPGVEPFGKPKKAVDDTRNLRGRTTLGRP